MADIESQIRRLAEGRFAQTTAVSTDRVFTAGGSPNGTDAAPHDEGDVLMVDLQTRETVDDAASVVGRRSRVPWLVAAAAAIAVLAIGLTQLDWGGESSLESADDPASIVLLGAESDPAAIEAFARVRGAFEAFNAGDIETWLSWREIGSDFDADEISDVPGLERRLTVEQCTYRGFGSWMMDDPLVGHGFECAVGETDRLLGAAGIELRMNYVWVIGDGPETSQAGSNENFREAGRFYEAFAAWLDGVDPAAAAEVRNENVVTALDHIDAFVEQSEVYPLTEPVPPMSGGALEPAE